jgi:translocation and assembly module TamB
LSAAPQFPPGYGPPEDSAQQPPRSPRRPLWQRILFWTGVGLVTLLLLVVVGVYVLLHSRSFHGYVLTTAQQKATQALGAPVHMQEFALNFSGISPTLDVYGVVVDGAAPYANPPLLQVQHARVGVRIVSLLHKSWYLSDVSVNHPVVQVFVDKQGRSNLPTPSSGGGNSNTNVFDLAIEHALLDRGEVFYNNRKSVIDADLHNLTFTSGFDNASRRYAGTMSYNDGHLTMETFNTVNHGFRADFAATPEKFTLHHAVLRSGTTIVSMDATLENYASPKINAVYNAVLDSGEFRHILKNPTLPSGLINLGGKIQYVVQSNVPLMKGIVVDGMLSSGLLQVQTPSFRGNIRNLAADYTLKNGDVDVRNLRAALLGGELNGHLTMRDLTGDSRSHLEATLRGVSLAQAKSMLKSPAMDKVGLSGGLNANADATWGKSFDDLQATSNMTLQATLTTAQSNNQVPVNGVVHAKYSAPAKQITLSQSFIRTPQTSINLNGTVSNRSALQVRMQANDLHEIETLADMFQTPEPGKTPQPMNLGGAATFNGAISGSTNAPHVTGQLVASDLSVRGTKWRRLRTNVDASPERASLKNGELDPINRGRITFDITTALHQWSPTKESPFEVALTANQLDVGSLAKAAGAQAPVQGTLSAKLQAHGTQLSPIGQGDIRLTQAKVSGETVQAANINFQGTGDAVHADLDVHMPAGVANGVLTYYPKTEAYEAQLRANGVQLNQLQAIKDKNLQLQGVVDLNATGRGTVKDPQLTATVQIPKLVIENQTINGISLQTQVANHVANVSLDSQAINTSLKGRATIRLAGDYQTDATIDTQPIPLAPLVAAYAPELAGNVTGQTELHGTLRGPLKNKERMEAHITVPTLAVNYKNTVQIGAPQPIHLDYANGVLNLQRSALRGTDTDLQFQGRVPLLDKTAPVSLLLLGTVDLRLMQLFNPDVVTSGQLQFDINSFGQRSDPNVQGQVRVVNAAFASGDAPVGLTNGNGVLTLTRNRLEITRFTGKVGGGDVTARGGVVYRPNVQFDMALSGDGIRMMYPDGVRSGVGMNLFLTGTTDAAMLRGQVNLEQLSFSPDFDLTEIMGQFGGATAPPPTQGFSNNLQLDMAVRSTQGLNLVNRQLSLQGSMNLNVRGTAAQPVVLGRINLSGGDFLFNNERFVLQGGTIDFVNPSVTQPVLNVSVNTTVHQYNVAMRFEGPVDHMRTSYTSDPALPPADIIHLIAFGSTSEAAAANPSPPGNLAAEQKIASAVSGQVTSRVAKIAGLSQLSIDPTLGGTGNQSNPGATITVQQRVTSKIFVTFSTDVTSTQNQVIQLEYKQSPRLSFSGTRDQNGGVAFDTRIHKSW